MDLNMFLGLDKNEKPLDNIVSDGGYTSIFRTIGCIGDSLSSGEFEAKKLNGDPGWYDFYEYSWGQFIARMCGSTVYNFSKGGMTTKEYCESFASARGFWGVDKACQAYIIALGVNDLNQGWFTVGSTNDICREDYTKNKPTFAGYYAQIIQRYKQIQPDAKFFFVAVPESSERSDKNKKIVADMTKLFYELAEFFDNSYVIDLEKYAPDYASDEMKQFKMLGHFTPCGYVYTAKIIASYIDYIIRHNIKDFDRVGFIGKNCDIR